MVWGNNGDSRIAYYGVGAKMMQGKISSYIIIPIICAMVVICFGAFFVSSQTTSNPLSPYQANQTYIGTNFFSSVTGFTNSINQLVGAIQRMVPTDSNPLNVGGMAVSTWDAGTAIIKIFIGIPILIGSFIYDIVRLLLAFLPAQAPPELFIVISMAVLLPILAIIMELASSIKPPGLAKW
jgi:hypothetical protein